ncbi:hypothetical protein [Erythrobacter sp. JK5]|uniref:hypothetical protein n=1 Tax=Erythrobacter sp. JK5 TaxID=2829500 RepID=UPI001BAC879E|nr:hypothetical protein [Erythrobacter sp. JK5]QUL37971.1 hypothetical protein KDC96_00595 [Erythrobacter sp. JK5]
MANVDRIRAVMAELFDQIDAAVLAAPDAFPEQDPTITRLHTLLVDGTDQLAASLADERGWDLISPLPFGQALNLAINALPQSSDDARRLLRGEAPLDAATRDRADSISTVARNARLFELADRDEAIADLYLAKLESPDDFAKAEAFALEGARRAELAGTVLIEQSDILIAVWDGASTANVGGTGHTVFEALKLGTPVIWIDPAEPEDWCIRHSSESLVALHSKIVHEDRIAALAAQVRGVVFPADLAEGDGDTAGSGLAGLQSESWRDKSSRWVHAYRRIEALFSGEGSRFRSLVVEYEKPGEIAQGSGAGLVGAIDRLPGGDAELARKIRSHALRPFAWADGVSSRLSDHYRSGMIVNFLLSALAIVGGVLYLPLVSPEHKWGFALFEFLVLVAIVIITYRGRKYRWHARWFETRRIAEYFRHSPLLLILGVARPAGHWPRGAETSWPEWYVRQALRDIGLPRAKVTASYLRSVLEMLDKFHVTPQRDYHQVKARRLENIHANLDGFSEFLFKLALISVATYLVLKGGAALDLWSSGLVTKLSKTFTVLGVLFPTLGAAIAGIRYFGDFERFAAISEVTAEQLDAIARRIDVLLQAPDQRLSYASVRELAHAADDVVFAEIENWQAVFGGKHITIPV